MSKMVSKKIINYLIFIIRCAHDVPWIDITRVLSCVLKEHETFQDGNPK
jgi:hypothetical protein